MEVYSADYHSGHCHMLSTKPSSNLSSPINVLLLIILTHDHMYPTDTWHRSNPPNLCNTLEWVTASGKYIGVTIIPGQNIQQPKNIILMGPQTCLTLKQLGHFFCKLILFSSVVHFKCNIFFWNWPNAMNVWSSLWILMVWCLSEWVIKFNGLFGDSRHWGPCSPYKPCNHSLIHWNHYLPSHR